MIRIGLTGGIATGKSTIAHYLKTKGAYIIDADAIARELSAPNQPIWQIMLHIFGVQALTKNHNLNKSFLGEMIFHQPELRLEINKKTHPLIKQEIERQLSLYQGKVVVLDVPLLLEAGWQYMVNEVWLVYADYPVQVTRLCQRNGFSHREADSRIQTQMSMEEKKKKADFIIDNNDGLSSAFQQADVLWQRITAM